MPSLKFEDVQPFMLSELEGNSTPPARMPHLCPVCLGKGKVMPGFYERNISSMVSNETCRACGGQGVIIC